MTTVPLTEVKIPIEPRDSTGNTVSAASLRVQVSGPKRPAGTVTQEGNQIFVSFETDLTGEYTVTVIAPNGNPTVDTPVRVTVNEGKPGEENQSKGPLERHHNVRFECDAKTVEGAALTSANGVKALVRGPSQVTGTEISYSGGKFFVDFTTTVLGGEFTVEVLHNGAHIFRSPFSVQPAGKHVEGTVRNSDFKETVSFEIEAELQTGSRSVDPNRVHVAWRSSDERLTVTDVRVSSVPHSNPSLLAISFTAIVPPDTSAEIVCDVSQDGIPFSTSPVTVQLSS